MDIGDLVAHLKVDKKQMDKAVKAVDSFSDKLEGIGKVAAFSALGAGAIGLSAALKPAAGALLVLPAAAAVAGGAFAALKVGTSGVGDALSALADGDAKKAAEALAKLSPAAKASVLALDGVRKSYSGLKGATQDTLFRGLAPQITALGATYLPILQRGLTANAAALNSWALSGIAAAKSPFVTGAVNNVLGTSAQVMAQSSGAAGSLVTILAALAQAGLPLMSSAAGTVTRFLATRAAFLSSAQGAEWMRAKIAAAGIVLNTLQTIALGVGRLLGAMFTAAQGSGNQLLGTLAQLATAGATWAQSMEGQQQLTTLFQVLSQVLTGMLPIIGFTGQAIMTLAGFIAGLPGPVQGLVTGFLSFALVAGLVAPKLMMLVSGLRMVVVGLATAGGAMVMAAARMGLLGTAAAVASVQTNASALSVIRVWLLMAATAARSAIMTAASWALTAGSAAASAIASAAVAAAAYVGSWILMAASAMASAISMAAAWFVALGPIGWVIAAIIAVVALVIMNWDRVKQWTISAWNAVSGAVSSAVSAVINFVRNLGVQVVSFVVSMAARLVTSMVSGWVRAKAAVSTGVAAVVGFVRSLPGKILSALSRLGSLLVGLGRDMVRGLWNGIKAGWSWLTGQVRNLASSLLSAAKGALGIGSPSKEMRDEVGRWIPAGMAVGIRADGGQVGKAIAAVSRNATAGLTARTTGGRSAAALAGRERGFDYGAAATATADALGEVLATVGLRADFDPRGAITMQRQAEMRDRARGGAR